MRCCQRETRFSYVKKICGYDELDRGKIYTELLKILSATIIHHDHHISAGRFDIVIRFINPSTTVQMAHSAV
jgi:hypothetical protein